MNMLLIEIIYKYLLKRYLKRIHVYIIKEYEKEFKRQHNNKEDQFRKFDQKKQKVDRLLCEMF